MPFQGNDFCRIQHLGNTAKSVCFLLQDGFATKSVPRNNRNRHLFRQVSRDSTSALFDVPEDNRVVFCYLGTTDSDNLVGVASWAPARDKGVDDPDEFENKFHHVISFLFVKAHYKGQGLGSRILQYTLREMKALRNRPVRVQSAEKAVPFFEKHGFVKLGEPEEMVCCGSPLFRFLTKMEKSAVKR